MPKLCSNPNCKKELPDDANFCGYCKAKQEIMNFTTAEQLYDSEDFECETKDYVNPTPSIFYTEDYEVVRQFDPVVTPTKEQLSFENLLSKFQEVVKNKNYPFSVEQKEQNWRTEGGKGKQRIVIQPTHDEEWQKMMFSIAVDQMGNDTTIKLSILRKNEVAEFYYLTHDSICTFPVQNSGCSQSDIESEQMNLIFQIANIAGLEVNNPKDWESLKVLLMNLGKAWDEGRTSNEGIAKIISKHTGININRIVASDEGEASLLGLSSDLLWKKDHALSVNVATDIIANMHFTGGQMIGVPKINMQSERYYEPIIAEVIRVFSETIEGIMSRLSPSAVNRAPDINVSIKNFINDFLNTKPQFSDHQKKMNELQERKKIAATEIEKLQQELNQQSAIVQQTNGMIKQAADSLQNTLEWKKGAISLAVVFFIIFAMMSAGLLAWLVSLGIFGGWLLLKVTKASTLESLKSNDLQCAQAELGRINNLIYEKKQGLSKIDEEILRNRNKLIAAISDLKSYQYEIAKQLERIWSESSIVDEELEQLISVIKNLFNQIIGKLTEKKEKREMKLQSTLGLGGMDFQG